MVKRNKGFINLRIVLTLSSLNPGGTRQDHLDPISCQATKKEDDRDFPESAQSVSEGGPP